MDLTLTVKSDTSLDSNNTVVSVCAIGRRVTHLSFSWYVEPSLYFWFSSTRREEFREKNKIYSGKQCAMKGGSARRNDSATVAGFCCSASLQGSKVSMRTISDASLLQSHISFASH